MDGFEQRRSVFRQRAQGTSAGAVEVARSPVAASAVSPPQPPENPYRCDCKSTVLRIMTQRNGVEVVVRQCPRCGRNCGAVKKAGMDLSGLEAFDEELKESWQQRSSEWYQAQWRQRQAAIESQNEEWWDNYNAYLETPEWRARRDAVLKRANWICEGCGKRPAIQVHHTTYEHVGHEMLWELRAVCLGCHEWIHSQ